MNVGKERGGNKMKNITLLEEIIAEQEFIITTTGNTHNKSKLYGILQALELMGYYYHNGKIFK